MARVAHPVRWRTLARKTRPVAGAVQWSDRAFVEVIREFPGRKRDRRWLRGFAAEQHFGSLPRFATAAPLIGPNFAAETIVSLAKPAPGLTQVLSDATGPILT